MDDYRKQGLFVDVNFVVSSKEFKAHKVVLSCQSAVLEAMFTSGMTEAQSGLVNIIDIKPDVFEVFLTYFYTHSVPETALSAHLEGLLYCADKYVVPHLTNVCSQYLKNNFPLVRRLILADMYCLSHVKTKAAEEIAKFGWERLEQQEWFEMFAEFRLTADVLHLVLPSCLVKKWTITPDMWLSCPTKGNFVHLPPIHLRNNGRPCKISVSLQCVRKTVTGSVVYHSQNSGPKVVELSFEFNVGVEAHFCGKGDLWWDSADMRRRKRDKSQGIFRHTFSSDSSVKNVPLEFSLTLRQWTFGPVKLPLKVDISSFAEETALLKINKTTFNVNKGFACRESEFFRRLMLENRKEYEIESTPCINEHSLDKIGNYLLTGVIPHHTDVNFDMILCARALVLTNLCNFCEHLLNRSLNDMPPPEAISRSLDLLIFAVLHGFTSLLDSVMDYIDCHLKEVISSPDWLRLKDRPDLLYLIVQRVFASSDPGWSDGPDSDSSSADSETEVEAMMDRVDF